MNTATNPICSSTSCSFTYVWDTVPSSGGTFYVDAAIGGGGSAGAGNSNGVIDKVLGLDDSSQPITFSYTYTNPSTGVQTTVNEVNPAADTNFGPGSFSTCSASGPLPNQMPLQLGDDQMCLNTYPYNGNSAADPYGTCEWTGGSGSGSKSQVKNGMSTGTNTMQFCSNSTPEVTAASTVDSLDETMHILSHFDIFAQKILAKDLGTINSTFDNWYSQAASWIAPACAGSTCTGGMFSDPTYQSCTKGMINPCNPYCQSAFNTTNTDVTCNMGSAGKMLSIYDPYGYPGVVNVTSNTTVVDELKVWNSIISSWLNTSYTPASSLSKDLWCVPTESTASGLEVTNSGADIPTAEDNYIKTNAPTETWGDVAHVIACLNYNAGTTPTGGNPNASIYQTCLKALTASGTCPGSVPYQCAAASPPLLLSANDCDPYYVDPSTGTPGYAAWLNAQINFGAANSYYACLQALTTPKTCPTTSTFLPEACKPWFLGRDLLNEAVPNFYATANECADAKDKACPDTSCSGAHPSCTYKNINISCDPTYSDASGPSFAKWVKDSMTLFTNEQPKFALRSAYLTDIYNRAQTMQNIFAQGDNALHNFFKPCDGCADGSACPTTGANAGICDDGSKCGPPSCDSGAGVCNGAGTCSDGTGSKCNYCQYGGPAAQLIYAKSLASPVRALPNSVIYGWVDQTLPNGQTMAGTPSGQPGGYAHIVKVTAYSPGRDAGGPPGVQPVLPWIHSWNTFLYQYYTLDNRDGNVYVSIQRWDQDHANANSFPNGRALWQFLFHKPSATATQITGNSLLQACSSGTYDGIVAPNTVGFGLQDLTVQGLSSQNAFANPNDKEALSSAFMLNDNGDGTVDPEANPHHNGQPCGVNNSSPYCTCLEMAVTLLQSGMESHSCARYTAALNGDDPSNTNDSDYSLKFMDCNGIDQGYPPASSP